MDDPGMREWMSKVTHTQEMHTCGNQDHVATLEIRREWMGGDGTEDYLVINASEWAVNDAEEIYVFAAKIKAMLPSHEPHG
jgi:hypothetical protein